MTVYVETNLLLELAYEQLQAHAAQRFLTAAEAGTLSVAIPAFCFTEARMSLRQRHRQRRSLIAQVEAEARELSRSAPFATFEADTMGLKTTLIASQEAESLHLEVISGRALSAFRLLSPSDSVLRLSADIEGSCELNPQDALVLSSVVSDLNERSDAEALFVNRNTNDFRKDEVIALLRAHHCNVLTF
jgi:predicted nucleic acid-binding protein